MTSQYRQEVDISEELCEDEKSYYHSLIGVFRWIVELVHAYICCEVSMLSSHPALPWRGYLEDVLHMFAFLKFHANYEMAFDPSSVDFDRALFPMKDWDYLICR